MSQLRTSIARILDVMSSQIGVGGRATLMWARTGAAEFDLLAGKPEQWTAERIYGRLGRFSVDARPFPAPPSESVQIVSPYLQYEIVGRNVIVTGGAMVANLAPYLAPVSPVASDGAVSSDGVGVGASPVGFLGGGVMSLFSLLPVIWSLLNPRFTLVLPSEIIADVMLTTVGSAGPSGASQRQLLVEFTRGQPVVKAAWGIQFTMAPIRLAVTESVITADYRAGIFSRSQTWRV